MYNYSYKTITNLVSYLGMLYIRIYIVTTPPQPQHNLNSSVGGCNMEITLQHHPPQTTTLTTRKLNNLGCFLIRNNVSAIHVYLVFGLKI